MERKIVIGLLCGLLAGCSGGVGLAGDGTDGTDGSVGDTDGDHGGDALPEYVDVLLEDAHGEATDAGGDVTDGGDCAAMDAHAEGTCGLILDGVVWDGAHCRALGTGCGCGGADCGTLYDSVAECVAARRACYGDVCGAQEAAGRICDGGGCAIGFGPFWDGRACYATAGCECAGADCGAPFASMEECDAVHAACDGALCRATGGRWFPAAAGFCGFACGQPLPEDCFTPIDGCDCPPGQTFVSGLGCETDAVACDSSFLCTATGGTWHPESDGLCPFHCGVVLPECYVITATCDCGMHANFDATDGCLPDTTCADTDPAAVCTSTGGTWHPAAECHCPFRCGTEVPECDACSDTCDCGRLRNFDGDRGCVLDDTCVLRDAGADCLGFGPAASCRGGLVCCPDSGISAHASCRPPCCPDDPTCMDDGCPAPPP